MKKLILRARLAFYKSLFFYRNNSINVANLTKKAKHFAKAVHKCNTIKKLYQIKNAYLLYCYRLNAFELYEFKSLFHKELAKIGGAK